MADSFLRRHTLQGSDSTTNNHLLLVCPFAVVHDNVIYGTSTSSSSAGLSSSSSSFLMGKHKPRDNNSQAPQRQHQPKVTSDDLKNDEKNLSILLEQDEEQDEEENTVTEKENQQPFFHSSNEKEEEPLLLSQPFSSPERDESSNTDDHHLSWWTWKNDSLMKENHTIRHVCGNADGSLVAVACPEQGTVSLLRGSDGRILATRSLTTTVATTVDTDDEGSTTSIEDDSDNAWHLEFVAPPHNQDWKDVLWIEYTDNNQNDDPQRQQPRQLLLVTHLDGTALNATDEADMWQAAKRMELQRPSWPVVAAASSQQQQRHVWAADSSRMRVVMGGATNDKEHDDEDLREEDQEDDVASRPTSWEYDLETQTWQATNCSLDTAHVKQWNWNLTQVATAGETKLLVTTTTTHPKQLIWCDASTFQPLVTCPVHECLEGNHPRVQVLGIVPLEGWHETKEEEDDSWNSMVACWVQSYPTSTTTTSRNATKNPTELLLIQAVWSTTQFSTRPQVLFRIPIPQGSRNNESLLQRLSRAGSQPGAVRIAVDPSPNPKKKSTPGDSNVKHGAQFWDFVPPLEIMQALGRIRHCLARGDVEGADQLVQQHNLHSCVPHSDWHPLLIPLQRLEQLVARNKSPEEDSWSLGTRIKECVTLLGADPHYLLEACHALWNFTGLTRPKDVVRVWTLVDSCLTNVLQSGELVDRKQGALLQTMRSKVQDRLAALELAQQWGKSETGNNDEGLALESSLLSHVKSTQDVVAQWIQKEQYDTIIRLWSTMGKEERNKILKVDIVTWALCQHGGRQEPQKYLPLLRRVILPSLGSLNHPLLPTLRAWCCQAANQWDDQVQSDNGNGLEKDNSNLEAAILLLRTMHRGICDLQLEVHASFAQSSPFVDGLQQEFSKRSPRSGSNTSRFLSSSMANTSSNSAMGLTPSSLDVSVASKSVSRTTFSRRTAKLGTAASPVDEFPNPSVLQMRHMEAGAKSIMGDRVRLARQIRASATDEEEFALLEENEECVAEKLKDAECLLRARQLGMPQSVCALRNMQELGGFELCIKHVIWQHLFGKEPYSASKLFEFLEIHVQPFCASLGVDFDKALLDLIAEICQAKNVSEDTIQQSSHLARCCLSDASKCRGCLKIMRAALLQGLFPSWLLNDLSRKALSWAICDTGLTSEVEFNVRLLAIHKIIARYCGSGARELFHAENPLHASRLLAFMTKQVHTDSLVEDVLSLCESFTHLSAVRGCTGFLINATVRDGQVCFTLFNRLLELDFDVAHASLSEVMKWIIERMREDKHTNEKTVDQKTVHPHYSIVCKLQSMLIDFQRKNNQPTGTEIWHDSSATSVTTIVQLRTKFGIPASPIDTLLTSQLIDFAILVLEPVAQAFATKQLALCKMAAKRAQKACVLLLAGSRDEAQCLVAVAVAILCRSHLQPEIVFDHYEFLRFLGFMDGENNEATAVASVAVGTSICKSIFSDARADELSQESCRSFAIGASLIEQKSLWAVSHCSLPTLAWLNTLVDCVGQVLAKADLGFGDIVSESRLSQVKKAWNKHENLTILQSPDQKTEPIVDQPMLNPTWYISDGLLLPPHDALSLVSWFFREMSNGTGRARSGTLELLDLTTLQGSHGAALRILATAMAHDVNHSHENGTSGCDEGLLTFFDESISRLATRCLGGTEGGMTSGIVDSQLSTAFLLSMPTKAAFKLYQSSIPMALKTNSFDRLLSLSNVGQEACARSCIQAESAHGDAFASVGWRNQTLFLDQCRQLSENSLWWRRLADLSIQFDTKTFTDSKGMSREQDWAPVELLLSNLISVVANRQGIDRALALGLRFSKSFGRSAETALFNLILFLCTPPVSNNPFPSVGREIKRDVRSDLKFLGRAIRDTLRKVRSGVKRVEILRDCLVNLESSAAYGTDYERYELVLHLYHENLLFLLEYETSTTARVDIDRLEIELELVDRRRDALSILSANFDKKQSRPNFCGFFHDVEEFLRDGHECKILDDVLGRNEKSFFDPLKPLHDTMSELAQNTSAAATLAPLCLSLGLPQGHIRARFLITRFQLRANEKRTLPSFENDVQPVLDKLRSPRDKMRLAEWCAEMYVSRELERLSCITVALEAATQASHDAEAGLRSKENGGEPTEELYGHIKRLSKSRTSLFDRLKIKEVLSSFGKSMKDGVSKTVGSIISDFDQLANDDQEATPEEVLNFLLSKGSMHAASACTDNEVVLSSNHFRSIVTCIVSASRFLEKEHSHVHPETCAKRMARQLLFYGNDIQYEKYVPESGETPLDSSFQELNIEEDTASFVMDLGAAQVLGGLKLEAIGSKTRMTSNEEPSGLTPCSSREVDEAQCCIASLRTVFLLAFADRYVRSEESDCDENDEPKSHEKSDLTLVQRKRGGLLSRIEIESKRDDLMLASARELLRIVFSDFAATAAFLSNQTSFAFDNSNDVTRGHPKQRTVTYAMRHRALRTASFLFPQKVLERIVYEEKFLDSTREHAFCTLKQCTFGTFVAKEIESMGLPLPHSDLAKISSMDFSSYARALWRNYCGRDMTGYRGRLLVLLFEMGLRSDASVDAEFLTILMEEMNKVSLPRSLLLSLEALTSHREQMGHEAFFEFQTLVNSGLEVLLDSLLHEMLGEGWSSQSKNEVFRTIQSLKRLFRILRNSEEHDAREHSFRSLVEKTKEATSILGCHTLALEMEDLDKMAPV